MFVNFGSASGRSGATTVLQIPSLPTHGNNLAGVHAIIDSHFAGYNVQEICTGSPGSNFKKTFSI